MEKQKVPYAIYSPYPFPRDGKWKKPMSNLAMHPSLDTSWQCWLNAVKQEDFIWAKYQMARGVKWNNRRTSSKLQTWSSAENTGNFAYELHLLFYYLEWSLFIRYEQLGKKESIRVAEFHL